MFRQSFLAVLVLLACCVAVMQGLPTSSRERCLCKRPGMLSVKMDRVATVEYHQSSSSCGQEELLVTLKNRRRRCLNLNGEQGRTIKEMSTEFLNHLGQSCLKGAFSKGNWTLLLIQEASSDDEDQMTTKKYIPSIPPP